MDCNGGRPCRTSDVFHGNQRILSTSSVFHALSSVKRFAALLRKVPVPAKTMCSSV